MGLRSKVQTNKEESTLNTCQNHIFTKCLNPKFGEAAREKVKEGKVETKFPCSCLVVRGKQKGNDYLITVSLSVHISFFSHFPFQLNMRR